MQRFDALQLAEYLQSQQPKLIDVREPREFEICHIDNSLLMPMLQIPHQIDFFQPDQEYVIICHHGVRSMQVIRFLQGHHIDNLINLDGGVDAWAKLVDPEMAKY